MAVAAKLSGSNHLRTVTGLAVLRGADDAATGLGVGDNEAVVLCCEAHAGVRAIRAKIESL
jgi:hypothetical protein